MNKTGFVNNSSNLERFSSLQNKLSSLIETSKQEYLSKIAKKLFNPSISLKTYLSILKKNLMSEKVPCIPPIFHEIKFITNFREKTELFNSLFVKQCSQLIIKNTSVLPTNCENLTDKSLSNITFTDNGIGKEIKGLGPQQNSWSRAFVF